MIQYYLYFKALHLIFVVSWFAALFYMPRLLIYHIEAQEKPEMEREILSTQLKLMQKRLWNIISWPSAFLATLFALLLLWINPAWLQQAWMHIKLAFVVLLWAYHIRTHLLFKRQQQDVFKFTSSKMRIWNEVATVLLFAIVFLASLKSTTSWIFGVIGIIALGVLLTIGIKAYKKYRENHPDA